MAEVGDVAHGVARARERFLESGDVPRLPLRPGIAESWRRSRFSGVNSDRLDPPYFDDLDTDGRLVHAARPVLRRLEETLDEAAMSLLLTDARGRVLDRRVRDGALAAHLDGIRLALGFGYAEEDVGTNGIGTAIAARRVCSVIGSEHFTARLHTTACAAAPINDPLTGRPAGLLDITGRCEHAGPLMPAVVAAAAHDIEQRLLELGSQRERAMLAAFHTAGRHGGAILTVDGDLTIANRQAAELLEPADHTIVRDKVAELAGSGRDHAGRVVLSRGDPAMLRYHPVGTPGGAAALVEIDIADGAKAAPRARPAPRRLIRPATLRLAGTSTLFANACTELNAHCRAGVWALVEGEPGVGKAAVAEAVHRWCRPVAAFVVIEPESVADDPAGCLNRIVSAAGSPGNTVVLRHPDRYGPEALAPVLEWMRSAAGRPDPPWVVATAPVGVPLADDLPALLPVTVTVPALRHRIEDVRDLVPALLRRLAPGRPVSCGPAAMRLLSRSAWPGNVAELAQVLRHALRRRRAGEIQPEDLPESCQVTSRRILTQWETLERDAIVRALRQTGGDKAAAAASLGISRATIYRRISAFGILADPG